jgi:hypothetical protein
MRRASPQRSPLFVERSAQLFVHAASESGWSPTFTEAMLAELEQIDPPLPSRMQALSDYTASRTAFFDT